MTTVQKIKAVMDRKTILEHNIQACERGINHVNMKKRISLWTQNADRIDVDVSREAIIAVLQQQIQADKADLATIDKQLDAIGALMGAGNV